VEFLPCPTDEARCLQAFEEKMQNAESYAAFIFEPLIQGAGGMKFHSPDFLDQLIHIAKKNQVFCIADEIMTGFGRLGKWFALDYLEQKPDIICLSKGLTGGMMAMGVTACSNEVFEAFLSSDRMKTFFHSHSFTGNPLTCAAANASLDLLEQASYWDSIQHIQQSHQTWKEKMKDTKKFSNIRVFGTILAMEYVTEEASGYLNSNRDYIYQKGLSKGVLLRPLGNTIYVMPPYIISEKELQKIYEVIEEF
jgi:adenosylmethionine-8-amino-7-oxononanoate aminotransferase